MTLIEYLNSRLLIERERLKALNIIWGDLAGKYCADTRAVITEIERQIWELEEGI